MEKINKMSWTQLTKPFRRAKKKIREDEVVDLVRRVRKEISDEVSIRDAERDLQKGKTKRLI